MPLRLEKQHIDVVCRSYQPSHHRQHNKCRKHQYTTIPLVELRGVVADFCQSGECDALDRLHSGIYGHILQLLRLIVVAEHIGRVYLSDE